MRSVSRGVPNYGGLQRTHGDGKRLLFDKEFDLLIDHVMFLQEHQLIRRKGQAVTTDNPNHSKVEPSDQGPALLTNSQVESQVLLGGKRKRTPTFKAGNNAESLISKKTKLAKVRYVDTD